MECDLFFYGWLEIEYQSVQNCVVPCLYTIVCPQFNKYFTERLPHFLISPADAFITHKLINF
jgi:hypothetical protein